ncbi:hypothetical protein [Nonomuraea diastatica]|nr:hypothetical protein [Nonomuraea diastatica]
MDPAGRLRGQLTHFPLRTHPLYTDGVAGEVAAIVAERPKEIT